jgi:hypothetical protein
LATERCIRTYSLEVVGKEYLVIGAGVVLPLALFYYCATSDRLASVFAGLPFAIRAVLWSVPLVMFATLVHTIAIRRPVSVDSSGVTAYFLGCPVRQLKWAEITRIEKVRIRDPLYDRYMFWFFVRSAKGTIRFQDDLDDVQSFLSQADAYVQTHQIELVLVDRGRDTLAERLSKISDPARRKDWRRNGIRSPITTLLA